MPDKKGNLYLYEAIELRSEYDRHVELLRGLFLASLPESAVSLTAMMKKKRRLQTSIRKRSERGSRILQTKRVKLNQEIQKTNFETEIEFGGTEDKDCRRH